MRRAPRLLRRLLIVLKSINTLKTRPQRTTPVPWIYRTGKSTALGLCALLKKPTDLIPRPTSNRYTQDHFSADPYDLEILKGFVRMMAYGIDSAYSDPKAGEKPVLQY